METAHAYDNGGAGQVLCGREGAGMISDKSHAEAVAAYQRLVLHLEQEKIALTAQLTEARARNDVLHDEMLKLGVSIPAARLAQIHRSGVAAEGRAIATGAPEPLADAGTGEPKKEPVDDLLSSLAHV